jgi:hypothetical protein
VRGFKLSDISLVVVCLGGFALVASGCDESSSGRDDGSGAQTGGKISSGGVAGKGGAADTGGVVSTGGNTTTGGAAGTGGVVAAGGSTTTGGSGGNATGGPGGAGIGGSSATTGGAGAAGDSGTTTGGGAGGDDGGAGGSAPVEGGPCDIYASASPPTPCVAAYSMVRALSLSYAGNLYQVKKANGTTKDIPLLAPGGFADAAEQDAFCGADACTVSILYDQSGKGNHLTAFARTCYLSAPGPAPSNESNAKARSLMVSGHKVYALETIEKDGYRRNETTGMPVGDQAQGIYEVIDGTRFGTGCCWDFGNASADNCINPAGGVSALFFGTGYWGTGAGDGPWFMADFERGVWSGGSGMSNVVNDDNPTISYPYALGILKTNATSYAIRAGNARSGNLLSAYDGGLPFSSFALEGGIILGLAGDNSYSSHGTFFEGAITAGRPSDETDALVSRSVQSARYGE